MKGGQSLEDQLDQWSELRALLTKQVETAPQLADEMERRLIPPEGSPADRNLDSLLSTALFECSQSMALAALASDFAHSAMRSIKLYLSMRRVADTLSVSELSALVKSASESGLDIAVPKYARERMDDEPADDDLIGIDDMVRLTKLRPVTINKYVKLGKLPKPVTPPGQRRRWRFGDIRRHVDTLKAAVAKRDELLRSI